MNCVVGSAFPARSVSPVVGVYLGTAAVTFVFVFVPVGVPSTIVSVLAAGFHVSDEDGTVPVAPT